MTRSRVRHLSVAVAGAFALLLSVVLATPASASSMWFSKSSGRLVDTSWLEIGTLPGVAGNIHFGYMTVEDLGGGNAYVWGKVFDMTCPDGVIPDGPGGGGHDDEFEEEEPLCDHEGIRWIEGGDVNFQMDRKLSSASLTGTLQVFGHDGPLGNPTVNMTLTGIGSVYKSVESGRYSDGTESGSYRYAFNGRDAVIDGNIGPMVFDNTEGEWSEAQMGSFRSMERGRSA